MSSQLQQLIEAKRRWHHATTPEEEARGFRGWHSRGYLPHFDAPGVRQFVTWRLADSLPESRRGEWQHLLTIENEREKQVQLESYLDQGHGECVLPHPDIAAVVEETLLNDGGRRCRLPAWVVMPNHVHLLVEIHDTPLAKLLQSWKTLTSKRANALVGRGGKLWQADYRDRYIRDQAHYGKAVRYIENNPVKAQLVKSPEDWHFSSARFRVQNSIFKEPHLDRSADAHVRANPAKSNEVPEEHDAQAYLQPLASDSAATLTETRGRGRPRSD